MLAHCNQPKEFHYHFVLFLSTYSRTSGTVLIFVRYAWDFIFVAILCSNYIIKETY